MTEETGPDHITIIAEDKHHDDGKAFRRFPSRERRGSTGGAAFFRRTFTRERDMESVGEGFDVPRENDFHRKQIFHGWPLFLLAYQSAGVIYGDIGTSPLYVFSSTFSKPPEYEDLLGALSIIIWTLTLVVTIKYVCIVLNADNEGQGGTFAMYSLLTRYGNIATGTDPNKETMIRFQRHLTKDLKPGNRRARGLFEKHQAARVLLSGLAIFGVSLIISDGILTPAQSVLGAIQGLTVVRPNLQQDAIIGITCAVLVVIYSVQPLGIERISIVFAPIVVVWLFLNFVFGVYNLAKFDHSVLRAFSPFFAGEYFVRNKTEGWRSLGGILLCFTGVEALFADLGAFSKRAIQISWLGLAYPCLLMAYIGQAAYISRQPEAYSNPFFNSAPPGTFWPALIISILAAIVASQALITSTFQLLFQVVNMSYFPPIKMVNTSMKHHSQIYIPVANWLMMVGTIVVTVVFRDTTKLGHAYGVCVILDTIITTSLVSLVALIVWRIKWYYVLPMTLTFATLEGLYMTSALTKVPEGAWFTLTLAICLATVFSTWRFGKEKQWQSERKGRLPRLAHLVKKTDAGTVQLVDSFGGGDITDIKGLGIFFDKASGDAVPVIYQEFLNKFEAQPIVQVFLHLKATTVPHVSEEDQYTITRTGMPHNYRMVIRYGYAESVMTAQLGEIVYAELKKYIVNELCPDGRTSSVDDRNAAAAARLRSEKAAGSGAALSGHDGAEKPADAQTVGATSTEKQEESDQSRRLRALDTAYTQQVLYIIGKEELLIKEAKNALVRVFLNAYLYLRTSTNEKAINMRIPTDKLIEVGFIREI